MQHWLTSRVSRGRGRAVPRLMVSVMKAQCAEDRRVEELPLENRAALRLSPRRWSRRRRQSSHTSTTRVIIRQGQPRIRIRMPCHIGICRAQGTQQGSCSSHGPHAHKPGQTQFVYVAAASRACFHRLWPPPQAERSSAQGSGPATALVPLAWSLLCRPTPSCVPAFLRFCFPAFLRSCAPAFLRRSRMRWPFEKMAPSLDLRVRSAV